MTHEMIAAASATESPFMISAKKMNDETAEVRIVGTIGWDNDAETFRRDIDTLLSGGVKNVHLYINSGGGSCFDAAEIVNILSQFDTVTGEGGALVASAATYIAVHCKTFSMPANGQFMVHKPSAGAWGNTTELENTLKLLKDTEDEYCQTYKGVVKDTAEFEKRWNAGDWWMTAQEAKEMGFASDVKDKIKIDKATAAMLTACGKSTPIINNDNNLNNNKMDLELIALLLGLPKDSDEAKVKAELERLKKAETTATTLQAELKKMCDAQITSMVDDAIKASKTTADNRQKLIDLGNNAGLDTLKSTLEMLVPSVKPTDFIKHKADGTSEPKAWGDLKPDERVQLRESDPKAYAELYEKEYGIKPAI